MAEAIRRVLIVEHDLDMATLFKTVLDDEGYDVGWILESPTLLEEVRNRNPDLLLVDVSPCEPDPYQILDALRTDPITRRIPVLAMTTAQRLAEVAIASFNVRSTLMKPFEIGDFLGLVSTVLHQPPLEAEIPQEVKPPTAILAMAERVFALRSRETLFRWVQRLLQQPPWKGRTDLQLPAALDHIPVIAEALHVALHYGDPQEAFDRQPKMAERVRQHAKTRRQQGIPLAAVVREYTCLRDEFWGTFERYLPKEVARDDMLALERVLNGTLDRVVETIIPAYLEAEEQASA